MSDLIFDIGGFQGQDTDFYLKKGFRVVAVEANPEFAEIIGHDQRLAISDGRLKVIRAALATEDGERAFFVHDHGDWSSMYKNARFVEGSYKTISVKTLNPFSLFAAHPRPYYVKIDIEGADLLVVEAICNLPRPEKPSYVSFEAGRSTKAAPELLESAGYKCFKLSPQHTLSFTRLPRPPLEGLFVDYRFSSHNSGPFGKELPGAWVSRAELEDELNQAEREAASSKRGLAHWWDIHAALG